MTVPKSKRSGGPTTAQGKAVASHNAIKSGVYTRQVVLPGEKESDFQALLQQFEQDFSPQDVAESAMVRDLAILVWKQLRVDALEHSILVNTLNEEVDQHDLTYQASFECTESQFKCIGLIDEPDFDQQVKNAADQRGFLYLRIPAIADSDSILMADTIPR